MLRVISSFNNCLWDNMRHLDHKRRHSHYYYLEQSLQLTLFVMQICGKKNWEVQLIFIEISQSTLSMTIHWSQKLEATTLDFLTDFFQFFQLLVIEENSGVSSLDWRRFRWRLSHSASCKTMNIFRIIWLNNTCAVDFSEFIFSRRLCLIEIDL